jgi:hypothetical protein
VVTLDTNSKLSGFETHAFYGSALTSIHILPSVEVIGDHSFFGMQIAYFGDI